MTPDTASAPRHTMPFVRLELAVLAIESDRLRVLLGKRSGPPHEGRWALPGGVLRVDLDATLDAAVQRVARERLGTVLPHATQLCSVGGRTRDPRAPWALSVVYRCTTHPELPALPGKRLSDLRRADALEAAQDERIAFDHAQVIARAIDALRADVDVLRFPAGLIDEPFTLTELQNATAVVLDRKVDKASFRRRVDAAACVVPVEGERRTGAYRPAQLYRLRSGEPLR